MDIPKTKEELEEQVDLVAKRLKIFGLSKYEARAYLGLIAMGFGPAETIANTARIPRTSAYKVLDSLCAKKFATSTSGRPKIYRPVPPQKLNDRMVDDINDLFRTIKALGDIVNERGLPLLVYSITGTEKVIKKIVEMIDTSTESIVISSPQLSMLMEHINKPIQNALKRDVSVTILTLPSQRVPEKVKVIRKDDLFTTDMVIDNALCLMTSVDMKACGFTDNEFITLHMLSVLTMRIGP